MPQAEIINAIEHELNVSSRSLKFTVKHLEKDAAGILRVFIDPMASRGLDDSLEGAAAWWPGQPSGKADVLSVAPEHDQLNLRFVVGPPPRAGAEIRIYPPRYLEALRDIWETSLFASQSLDWLERFKRTELVFSPDTAEVRGFPNLRARQRQAFELLEAEGGFLWGPPGTGKTHTIGALLATFLCRKPKVKVLLLSTTNTAVDLALLAVDRMMQELERVEPEAGDLRRRLKRIGNHFTANSYKNREHLLPVVDPRLVAEIAELEGKMPDKANAAAYARWKDEISSLRARIIQPLDHAQLAAMTTTSAAFQFNKLYDRRHFDLLVFDEASQVSLPHALALAPLGKRVIFAGDHKQLAPIVLSDHPDAKKWLGASMFKFMTAKNRCFLNEQSRMAEEICDVISHGFYEGDLILAEGCERDAVWRSERMVASLKCLQTRKLRSQHHSDSRP